MKSSTNFPWEEGNEHGHSRAGNEREAWRRQEGEVEFLHQGHPAVQTSSQK